MPYSADHKQQSRQRILEAAVDLFCRRGFDQISITQIMQHAQMTHGAFYAHFSSKGALYAEALQTAAQNSLLVKQGNLTKATLLHLMREYLSLGHVKQQGAPCPLAFLATDVAHRDVHVRASYERIFNGMVARLAALLTTFDNLSQPPQSLAHYLVATLVGTVAIARTLNDETTQQSLLDNAHTGLLHMLNMSG